jgi:hypothetical protein
MPIMAAIAMGESKAVAHLIHARVWGHRPAFRRHLPVQKLAERPLNDLGVPIKSRSDAPTDGLQSSNIRVISFRSRPLTPTTLSKAVQEMSSFEI